MIVYNGLHLVYMVSQATACQVGLRDKRQDQILQGCWRDCAGTHLKVLE